MYSEYVVRCKDCEAEFTAIYDSRKNPATVPVTCGCGKLTVYPEAHSYSYTRDASQQKVSCASHATLDDYHTPSEELMALFEKVKVLAESLGFETQESYVTVEGQDCYDNLCLSHDVEYAKSTNEINAFEFSIDFHDSFKHYKNDAWNRRVIERLQNFYLFLLKVEKDNTILTNRKYLKETDFGEVDFEIEQHKNYDYKISF